MPHAAHRLMCLMSNARKHQESALRFLAACLLMATATLAHAQGTLYDDFGGGLLDPDRWRGDQNTSGPGSPLELQRVVENGRLLLLHRTVGDDELDLGLTTSVNQLALRNAGSVTGIGFEVTPTAALAESCSGPGAVPTASARAIQTLFNDGTADVVTTISARRISTTPAGQVDVIGILTHLVDGVLGFADLGTAPLGATVQLEMDWDATADQVTYRRDGGAPQIVIYDRDDSAPPNAELVAIELINFAPNCDGETRQAGMIALIDDVTVTP